MRQNMFQWPQDNHNKAPLETIEWTKRAYTHEGFVLFSADIISVTAQRGFHIHVYADDLQSYASCSRWLLLAISENENGRKLKKIVKTKTE